MNVIDIFSGSGGLSLGFGQAGFETTDAADSDDAAAATFQANHPSARSSLAM
jgi:DNA (cytosine-5)-methyltransferase 1